MEKRREAFLGVRNLEVVYHHVSTAVQGVSLDVSEKQIFAVIGGNGAGKTTTLRAISGFLDSDNAAITDGEVVFRGMILNMLPPQKVAHMAGIILVPERDKVFDTLTVEVNLSVCTRSGAKSDQTVSDIYEYFPSLARRKKKLAGFLSGGEKQMLAMGQALLCRPSVLLVDELSLGLAPLLVEELFNILVRIRDEMGLTILLVEQNASAALSVAEYAAVMENGRVVFDGTPERLLAHEDVREFYLGMCGKEQKSYRDVKQYTRTRRWWG